MAVCLLILTRRLFDIRSKKDDLKILKDWKVIDPEILNLYLAKRPDEKHYLYAGYVEMDQDLGFYIKDDEVQRLLELNEAQILESWKGIF